ncbi:SICA antigen [Plasmodium coatneyi]|uniref:SICA antigen n=1 Tax=Plasmodium coatneyi TaxID=208452 RepID=A0A1B1DT10_9APIC|nr:SICA antigen [Plasmodium coatneyi]ANQ05725.1 SICA antigen [Plasmodium coatneyi]
MCFIHSNVPGSSINTRSTFWDKDVQKRLGDLSSAMTNGGTTDHASCNDITVTDGSSVESNKQACNYIVRGLEHIYRIQKEGDRTNAENIRKSDDNQLFTRTMNCVLLNAYADRLEQQSPCSQNEGVKHAFNAGNQLWNTICKNNGDTNCVPCKREPNFDCEIEYKNKSYNDKTEVKDEVEKLLQQNGQITNSLSTISSTNNTLCQRVQCVTVKWFKDRIYSEYRKQDWCTFWRENDVGKVLRDLSTAMKNGSKTDDKYCDDITVTDGTSNPQANKKACNFIARGLEDIYKIEPYGGWTGNGAEEKKKKNNNQQFYRTIGCAFLNVYADMLEKLPCVSNDVVQKAFGKSDQIKTNSTTCKTDPNCVTCTREKNLKCTLSVEDNLLNKVKGTSCEGDKQNIHKKLGKMLNPNENGDPKVRQALKEINNICPPPPSVKPATAAKPVEAPAAAAPSGRSDGDTEPVPVLPPGVPSGPQQADSNKAQPGKTPQIKADKVDISMPEAGGQAHIEITPGVLTQQVLLLLLQLIKVLVIPAQDPHMLLQISQDNLPVLLVQVVFQVRVLVPRVLVVTVKVVLQVATVKVQVLWYLVFHLQVSQVLQYFFLGKRRKRHRRAHQVSGSPPLGELLAHVDDQADGPRAYTLVKERRQRKSTPTGITKRPKKQGVGHRMIIDIHLEVLDECQKSDLHSTKEDFLKIIVEEFMGSEFIKEEKTREEVVPKEQVPSLYSGFRV